MPVLFLAHACASQEPRPVSTPPPAQSFRPPTDSVDLALIASGFEESGALADARARFEAAAEQILSRVSEVPGDVAQGRALLEALHGPDGLFSAYDARATTVGEVLERGAFNCLSSAVVYNVLAERLGLTVRAELLPTHARSLMEARGRVIVVETTSPGGFDPDLATQSEILSQVAGAKPTGRTLVPDGGTAVSSVMLIGAMYVNRASVAQEAGDLAGAERLFARGEALAQDAAMRTVLRDQRAALLAQLAADDITSESPARLPRAYRTILAAAKLAPADAEIRRAVLQNLRAAAERMIARHAAEEDEVSALAVLADAVRHGLEAEDKSGLRAFAMSEVSRLRVVRGDLDGAVEAIEQALAQRLAPRDSMLKVTLEQNRVAALRLAALTSAKTGDYTKSLVLIEKLESLPGTTGAERKAYEADRLRAIQLAGQKRIEDLDYAGAAKIYREGLRLFPEDETVRHNLVAVLERIALKEAEALRCETTGDVIGEIRLLDARSPFPSQVMAKCLLGRANESLKAHDFEEAVELLEAAVRSIPSEPLLARNLSVALLRWARHDASEGRCASAWEHVRRVEALESQAFAPAELSQTLGACLK